MVSSPEGFTDNITMSPGPSVTVKTPSAKKPIRLFTEAWYVKKDNSVRRVGDAKSKFKAIRAGSTLWSIIPKRRVNIKINRQLNDLPAKTGHVTRKKLTSCHNKKLIHIFLMLFPDHPQPNIKP